MEEKNIRKPAGAIFWEAKKSSLFFLSQPLFLWKFLWFLNTKIVVCEATESVMGGENFFEDFTTNIRIIGNEKGNDFQLKSAAQERTENQKGKDLPD